MQRELLDLLTSRIFSTIHIDSEPTPGAVAAITALRIANFPIRFVTNTTKESSSKLLAKLSRIGFNIDPAQVFTSLVAARLRVASLGLRPLLLLERAAIDEFDGIDCSAPHDAVVIGLSPSDFHYEKLNEAFQVLRQGGRLIAIHKGRYFARPADIALGPGPFVAALEYAADVTSEVVGKPSSTFFQIAIDSLRAQHGLQDLEPSEIAMIGDDVRDDVGGAIQHGIQGYLVQTGKYSPGDETSKGVVPTSVFATFADAVDHILAKTSSH